MDNLSKVNYLIDSGKIAEAWNALNEILTSDPSNEDAWLLAYSIAHTSSRDAILEKARKFLPSNSSVFNQTLPSSWLKEETSQKSKNQGRLGLIIVLLLTTSTLVLLLAQAVLRVGVGASLELPTPTPMNVSFGNLASLLVQEGDLPENYYGVSVSDAAPGMFRDITEARFEIQRPIHKDGERVGGITMFYFERDVDASRAFTVIAGDWTSLEYKGALQSWEPDFIGENAVAIIYNEAWINDTSGLYTPPYFEASEIAFYKCKAFFHIRLSGLSDFGWVSSYAQKLEARYTPLVCN